MPNGAQRRHRAEPTVEELEAGLSIDQNRLEDSVRIQPELFYDVSKQLTLAISRRDAAKRMVKKVEAKTLLEVRHQANANQERITVGEQEAKVILDRDVNAAYEELAELDFEVGELFGLRDSYLQRNEALRDMIKLYLQNYYGISAERPGVELRDADATIARNQLNRRRIAATKETRR